jgi:hypothetical protein
VQGTNPEHSTKSGATIDRHRDAARREYPDASAVPGKTLYARRRFDRQTFQKI